MKKFFAISRIHESNCPGGWCEMSLFILPFFRRLRSSRERHTMGCSRASSLTISAVVNKFGEVNSQSEKIRRCGKRFETRLYNLWASNWRSSNPQLMASLYELKKMWLSTFWYIFKGMQSIHVINTFTALFFKGYTYLDVRTVTNVYGAPISQILSLSLYLVQFLRFFVSLARLPFAGARFPKR